MYTYIYIYIYIWRVSCYFIYSIPYVVQKKDTSYTHLFLHMLKKRNKVLEKEHNKKGLKISKEWERISILMHKVVINESLKRERAYTYIYISFFRNSSIYHLTCYIIGVTSLSSCLFTFFFSNNGNIKICPDPFF